MLPNDDTFGLASTIAHGNQRSRLRCQPHVRPGSDGVSDRLVHPDQQQRRFLLIDCWFMLIASVLFWLADQKNRSRCVDSDVIADRAAKELVQIHETSGYKGSPIL